MPTSRTFAIGAVLALILATGCAAHPADGVAVTEGELGASPKAAGIEDGSLEAEGVLLLTNDRAVSADVLVDRAKLPADVASAIVAFRRAPDGSPRWFSTVDQIDDLPGTDDAAFRLLVADARAQGYIEAPGFDPPAYRLSIPDNLGRPPTAADVTVETGFDGKSPDEVTVLVRSRLTNTVDPSNERFASETIRATHKAFTIAVSNLFAPGSPHAAFAKDLGADKLTMLGTASAVKPTILLADKGGTKTYYARGDSGGYEAIAPPTYPVLMRARVALDPAGVRVFYPAWSAKVLAGPTTVIVEGGGSP